MGFAKFSWVVMYAYFFYGKSQALGLYEQFCINQSAVSMKYNMIEKAAMDEFKTTIGVFEMRAKKKS